ncbi:hypothetical protein ACOME3_009132 [Neoechinorhynchus agilis]
MDSAQVLEFEQLKAAYERHAAVQKLNDSLEERLLRNIDIHRTTIDELNEEVHSLRIICDKLKKENDELAEKNKQLKSDCKLAVSLLKSSPDNYRTSLTQAEIPKEVRVRLLNSSPNIESRKSSGSDDVDSGNPSVMVAPMLTFPPTAGAYNFAQEYTAVKPAIAETLVDSASKVKGKSVPVDVISDFLLNETCE